MNKQRWSKAYNAFRFWLHPLTWGVLTMAVTTNLSVQAETYLPLQGVTIGGRLTVPSCTVRLDADSLRFERGASGSVAPQYQHLTLSQCDVEGVDVQFQARTWSGYPDRGALKSAETHQLSTGWYYQVAPASPESPGATPDVSGTPLTVTNTSDLVRDASALTASSPSGCFRLDGVHYGYDVIQAPQGNAVRIIPLTVSVHNLPGSTADAGDLEATFSLSLTYR